MSVLRNRRALGLLACLTLQRLAAAGFPIVLIVLTADLRGYSAAAASQGLRVLIGSLSAPLRARLLDRLGRDRIIVPQTMLASGLLVLLGVVAAMKTVPLPLFLLAAIAPALVSPSTDSVIRTLWRTLGSSDQQIKALHSVDSIIEEVGYLAGPLLASGLMITIGAKLALATAICMIITGYGLVLLSRDVRSALQRRSAATSNAAPANTCRARFRQLGHTLAGPIASRELQRIVVPLILMGSVFGVVGILAPALCAQHGSSADAGFVIACISIGGVIGAVVHTAVRSSWSLRMRHAVFGLIFSVPLILGVAVDQPWQLGLLLTLGGLAVTPLYINAYLMMDAYIPDNQIHEANTWVPVGNNVGYVLGIAVAANLLGRHNIKAAEVAITVFAAVFALYSVAQLRAVRRVDLARSEDASALAIPQPPA